MTVSRQSVDAMARILQATRGNATALAAESGAPVGGSTSAHIQQMADVLARFRAATNGSVQRLVKESERDPSLREALVMEPLLDGTGARIGAWDIRVSEEGGSRKSFDVVRSADPAERIAEGLRLYETAVALVRLLNEGRAVNSAPVAQLLRDEQVYASALHDAVLFKRRIEDERKGPRRAVFEARYSEARDKAMQARNRLRKRVSDLP